MPALKFLERLIRVHGADLTADAAPVLGADLKTVSFHQQSRWDSDGFFSPQVPTRVTIPNGLGGRYSVLVNVLWNAATNAPFSLEDRDRLFVYGEIGSNADPDGRLHETRCAQSLVAHTVTSPMRFQWEGELASDHFIEVRLMLGQDMTSVAPAQFDRLTANVSLHLRRLGNPA